jgi:ribonuclease HI
MESIKKNDYAIEVYSDSKYVCDAINKNWLTNWQKKGWKQVKNVDLWKRFLAVFKTLNVRLNWVKGHAGIVENERCDELATSAAYNGPWQIDEGYEVEIK